MKCRKADIRKYGEQDMPYEVWAYEANDKAMITSLMEKLHNDPEIDVVLMDSPGSLKTEGLIPLFVNSDIIIVPFHYDLVTVPSTASFLMFVDRLKKAVGERMKARLFIIPNLNDGRIGKRSELLIWDNARDTFSNYGYVWKSHSTLTLLATQDLPTFLYYMIDPLKSWCWGAILFYPFKNSRFS